MPSQRPSLDAADQTQEKIFRSRWTSKSLKAELQQRDTPRLWLSDVWLKVMIDCVVLFFMECKFDTLIDLMACVLPNSCAEEIPQHSLKRACRALKPPERRRPGSPRGLSGKSACTQTPLRYTVFMSSSQAASFPLTSENTWLWTAASDACFMSARHGLCLCLLECGIKQCCVRAGPTG